MISNNLASNEARKITVPPKDSLDLTRLKGEVSPSSAQGSEFVSCKICIDPKKMDQDSCNNKEKRSFSDLQGDNSENKVLLTRIMRRNWEEVRLALPVEPWKNKLLVNYNHTKLRSVCGDQRVKLWFPTKTNQDAYVFILKMSLAHQVYFLLQTWSLHPCFTDSMRGPQRRIPEA